MRQIERAFAQMWSLIGEPLPDDNMPTDNSLVPAGEAALRVVATMPYTAGLFRLDQLVAALARERLWLTDAYYAGTTAYVQALRSGRARRRGRHDGVTREPSARRTSASLRTAG